MRTQALAMLGAQGREHREGFLCGVTREAGTGNPPRSTKEQAVTRPLDPVSLA